jgi:hypothetical protein
LSAKKSVSQPAELVRVAPLGQLNAYTVYEHELDALARGSSGSLYLNFALPLLSLSAGFIFALCTTKIDSDRLFQSFLTVTVVCAIVGVILLILWWREHRNSTNLISEIKNRMPPPLASPQPSPGMGAEIWDVLKRKSSRQKVSNR